jgi:multiple sugar transport system permease protein
MSIISDRPRGPVRRLLAHVFLAAVAIVFAFPFIWMLWGIFKTNDEIRRTPYRLLPASIDPGAFLKNLAGLGSEIRAQQPLRRRVGTVLTLAVSSLFAYAWSS